MRTLTAKGLVVASLTFLCFSLMADESPLPTEQTEPRVRAKYYSADAVNAIPRLKTLLARDPKHNKILFNLEGFPKNQEIIFEVKRLASENPQAYEPKVSFSIQDDGSMLIADTDHAMQTFVFSSRGFLPGERVVCRFRTADGSVSQEISGTPTPAVIRNKDHDVVLEAELVSFEPTVYRISLPTMEESEQYDLKSTSIGEIRKAKPKFTKKTPLHYSPAASKSKGGDSLFEIRRKSGEVYSIQLPWGTALQGYLHADKVYAPN